MNQNPTTYSIATGGDAFLVLISGRASYTTCRAFSDFLEIAPASGRRTLIIDLKECISIDSTVLGLIAGASAEFRKINGEIYIQHAGGRIRDVIINLGLSELLTLMPEEETHPIARALVNTEMETQQVSPANSSTILQAHEILMATNPENITRFKDVVAFMREDLGKNL